MAAFEIDSSCVNGQALAAVEALGRRGTIIKTQEPYEEG